MELSGLGTSKQSWLVCLRPQGSFRGHLSTSPQQSSSRRRTNENAVLHFFRGLVSLLSLPLGGLLFITASHARSHKVTFLCLMLTSWAVLLWLVQHQSHTSKHFKCYISSLVDYKSAWLPHLHKEGSAALKSGIQWKNNCCHFLTSVMSLCVVCRFMFRRFPLPVLNPGWVSCFFHFVAAGSVTAGLACSHILEINPGKTFNYQGCSHQCVQVIII